MKLIVEEGDAFPWAPVGPGVYEVEVDVDEVNMLGDSAQSLSFVGSLDLMQDPKPLPKGVCSDSVARLIVRHLVQHVVAKLTSHSAEAEAHERKAAMFTNSALPKTPELVEGSQLKWVGVADTYTISKINMVTDRDKDIIEISRSTWGHPHTYTRLALMDMIAKGTVLLVVAGRKAATCDKSYTDCQKHNNTRNFGGFTPDPTKTGACPHTFGGKTCGVGWDGSSTALGGQQSSGFLGNVVFPKTPPAMPEGYGEQMEGRQHRAGSDCDECFGTGLYKGMGAPCSHGCPFKGV